MDTLNATIKSLKESINLLLHPQNDEASTSIAQNQKLKHVAPHFIVHALIKAHRINVWVKINVGKLRVSKLVVITK